MSTQDKIIKDEVAKLKGFKVLEFPQPKVEDKRQDIKLSYDELLTNYLELIRLLEKEQEFSSYLLERLRHSEAERFDNWL